MSENVNGGRESLGSRLGFLLISAGCAIGIGNVWKFPYLCGQNGGGAFVLLYVFFLVILGIPVMTMEFALGRASRKSPVMLYQQLEKPGSKWHLHGYVAMAGNVILMMFYTTVAGWMLSYFVKSMRGDFVALSTDAVAAEFTSMLSSPQMMLIA
ncbi:MAG: sodium-dependent transporter, partial [Treponema sp.]|nr:sodium-dependent transporter [Treponema sp.]